MATITQKVRRLVTRAVERNHTDSPLCIAVFELTDSLGRKLFESISITLVCDDCLQTEHRKRHAILLCNTYLLTPSCLCARSREVHT